VRIFKSLVAVTAVAATATALAVAPAVADPVNSHGKAVKPKIFDVVGVGSNTTQFLVDQLSVNYNKAHSKKHNASHPWIYSWDATPPGQPDNITSTIVAKAGCPKAARPEGSGAGVSSLFANTKKGSSFCLDFSRSSGFRSAGQPAFGAAGGSAFVALAKDAVTWAANSSTNAPANLSARQLGEIYNCLVPAVGAHPANNWADLGGKSGTINPVLPQTTSGTRKFFLAAIGVATPGSCVNPVLPEENEGTAAVFRNNKNAVVPFSVGSYISQAFHSAVCTKKPKAGQNEFGCDAIGQLVLHPLNGTAPTTGTKKSTHINKHFTPTFIRTLYNVVRYAPSTKDHIPARLDRIFGRKGFFCSAAGKKIITAYGFNTTLLCGIAS
jgi:ABC-type phosphate transport system substrate-binding protein